MYINNWTFVYIVDIDILDYFQSKYCGITFIVRVQCYWLSWVALARNFTSPRAFFLILIRIFLNTLPTKLNPHKAGKLRLYPQTLATMNKRFHSNGLNVL